jgi:hypothetical protein
MGLRTGKRKVSAMRTFLGMAIVIGTGAIGFAAASQAGISLRPAQVQQTRASDEGIVGKYNLPTCHIDKTLKYDFNGNPYMKKVRVCA